MKRLDIKPGDEYGRWTVIEQAPHRGKKRYFKCKCSCGTIRDVSLSHMNLGGTKSCGCLNIEVARKRSTKHGHSRDPLHQVWSDMHRRCSNPKHRRYKDWGGRGICVCDEWMNFESFREWAMQNGYRPDLLIDRKDNDKGYDPSNCRWSTMKEQGNNRRDNRLITYDDRTMTLTQWADFFNIPFARLHWRVNNGWSFPRAIGRGDECGS